MASPSGRPTPPHAGGRPADRYGAPPDPARRRRRRVALTALGVAFAALVVVLALGRATAPVSFVARSFSVVDPETVRVEWEVARAPGTAVECQVRARGADGAEVGNELVVVPAAEERRTVVSHDLTTAAPAVTGEVRSCIVVG